MSDVGEEPQSSVKQITFNIKSSSDSKYVITVPEDISILDLKNKLSTSEYADIAAERQRLIYSGRVLKNEDILSTYNIKDGNTVHMVKGAASNQRQNPASSSNAAIPSNPASNVPSNIATGTGTDPLAGLTGARYAGFAQMPSAESFGADGGMGPPQGPDEMLRMLENPMFQGQMNEAMNNPHVIQMMQNSPMIRNNPMLRQMLENPEFRRTMMDPNMIRQSMQMQRMMGGGQGQGGMPAPGVTDTTPQQQGQNTGGQAPSPNPILGMGGGQGMGFGGQQGNPFAALFGSGGGVGAIGSSSPQSTNTNPQPSWTNPTPSPSSTENNAQQNTARDNQQAPQPNQQQPPNPFAGMIGGMPQPGQGQQGDAFSSMAQQMMQRPEMMRMAMQMMGGMNGQTAQQGQDQQGVTGNSGQAGTDPFASMFGPGTGGGGANPFAGMFGQGGGLGGANGGQPAAPQDSRPPEDQYADQLRQLNEMGFFEFERNVRALRMAGGNVSGAIEMLLSGTI